jgi:hypothetical protein
MVGGLIDRMIDGVPVEIRLVTQAHVIGGVADLGAGRYDGRARRCCCTD